MDRVYASFDTATKMATRTLACNMAEGMRWSSATLAAQGGVLDGEEQVATYCRHVLANPVIFTLSLLRLGSGLGSALDPDEHLARPSCRVR